MTLNDDPGKRPAKGRTEDQKIRRQALWRAREGDRRALEQQTLTRRYDELKVAMERLGVRIGPIDDLAQRHTDPVKRFEVLRARVERWEALWMVTLRKRMTRGKIVIGGAVLAELGELVLEDGSDQGFLARVVELLDRRVSRVHDRVIIRGLLTGPHGSAPVLPLRPGGPLDEPIEAALAALGERPAALGAGVVDEDEAGGEAEREVHEGGESSR